MKDAWVDELTQFRAEGTETWTTESGRRVTEFMLVPKWYRAEDGSWAKVDATVVPDEKQGGFRNGGASWSAHFGMLGEGVPVSFEGRSFTIRLRGRADVAPEVDKEDPSAVWYRDIAPGVDARFTVHPTGLEQDYVIRSKEGVDSLEAFDLGVESEGRLVDMPDSRGGKAFDFNADGKSGWGDGDKSDPTVRIAPPALFAADGAPIVDAKATLTVSPDEDRRGAERSERPVAVDFNREAVRDLPASSFPVTVDPMFEIIPASMGGGTWASFNQAANIGTNTSQWGLLGNWRFNGGDDQWNYSIYPGYSYLWTNISSTARVFSANLKLTNAQYPTNAAPFTTGWSSFPTGGAAIDATACHSMWWNYVGTQGTDY